MKVCYFFFFLNILVRIRFFILKNLVKSIMPTNDSLYFVKVYHKGYTYIISDLELDEL